MVLSGTLGAFWCVLVLSGTLGAFWCFLALLVRFGAFWCWTRCTTSMSHLYAEHRLCRTPVRLPDTHKWLVMAGPLHAHNFLSRCDRREPRGARDSAKTLVLKAFRCVRAGWVRFGAFWHFGCVLMRFGAFWHFGCALVRFGAFWHFGRVLVRFGTLGACWCVLVLDEVHDLNVTSLCRTPKAAGFDRGV